MILDSEKSAVIEFTMSCLDSNLRIEGKVSGDKMIVEFEVIQRSHEHVGISQIDLRISKNELSDPVI